MAENRNGDVTAFENGMYPLTSHVTGSEATSERCSNFYEDITKVRIDFDGDPAATDCSTFGRQLPDEPPLKGPSVVNGDVTKNNDHYDVLFHNGDDDQQYTRLNVQRNNNNYCDRYMPNDESAQSLPRKDVKKKYGLVLALVGVIIVAVALATVIGYLLSNNSSNDSSGGSREALVGTTGS